MEIVNWLRRKRFDPALIKLAKFFHLHRVVRNIYYKFILFADKKTNVMLSGYRAKFYGRSIDEVSLIDALLIDGGKGEIRVIEKILDELKAGDIAYDIGASVGTHAIFMGLKLSGEGKVFAFEPEIRSFEKLKANIKLNNLSNITAFSVALGDYSGEGVISGGLGSYSFRRESSFGNVEKVRVVEAGAFIRENNLPLPNVIKIDVEGYEYHVIRGLEAALSQKGCRMLACEIHPTLLEEGVTAGNIIALLMSYGFNQPSVYKRRYTIHTFFYKD